MRSGVECECWLSPDLAEIAFHTMKETSELLAFEGLKPRNLY